MKCEGYSLVKYLFAYSPVIVLTPFGFIYKADTDKPFVFFQLKKGSKLEWIKCKILTFKANSFENELINTEGRYLQLKILVWISHSLVF